MSAAGESWRIRKVPKPGGQTIRAPLHNREGRWPGATPRDQIGEEELIQHQRRNERGPPGAQRGCRRAGAAVADDAMLSGMTCIAEARGIPAMGALLAPMLPTADFAPPMQSRYGGFLNRLSHNGVDLALYTVFRPWWNRLRRDMLGLKPSGRFHNFRSVNGKPAPLLFAFSEALIPRPRDWPDGEDWAPPGLAAFLEAGPPPLYIGFGSMPLGRASPKAGVLKEALRRTGQRAIHTARGRRARTSDRQDSEGTCCSRWPRLIRRQTAAPARR
jgi:hypothetical protein